MTLATNARPAPGPQTPVVRLFVVCVPPILALVVVGSFLLVERVHEFGPSPVGSLSDAAARGNAARAIELILDGADPNGVGRIPAGILGAETFDLHPVDAAILGRQREMVTLLTRRGAVVPDRPRAECLARMTGFGDVLPLLGVAAPPPAGDPPVGPGEAWAACTRKKIEVRSTG